MPDMNYADSIEQSSEYLRLVLRNLGQHNLPADPLNYRLWYEHVSGGNLRLSQAIDELSAEGQSITPEICQVLYARFVSDNNKSVVENVRARIQHILAEILKQVLATGGDINHYSTRLESFTEQLLVDNGNTDSIKNLIQEILNDTRSMEDASSGLRTRLESISGEVEALREDLEKARQQATTDALTGLANRRAFDTALARETMAARGSQRELSLLMVDIDHFKRINDSFGHLVGDKVLIATAETIKDCVKGRDFVARFGGEEFVVLLPETDLRNAHSVAETIRTSFANLDWPRKRIQEDLGPLTLSVGIANYVVGESWESFIQRADRALYSCKNSGRNQVASCSA